MGTRHLVAAVIDDAFKIAQYGQFDGDPAGQGAAIYDFIRNRDIDSFKPKLRQLRWMNDEDARTVAAKPDWLSVYPQFARDAGAYVLDLVMDSPEPLFLHDARAFAGNSLFCEFAYVLDCDNDRLEVYKGLNKVPTPEDSRFPSGANWLEKAEDYEPVRLIATFAFHELKQSLSRDEYINYLTGLCDQIEAEGPGWMPPGTREHLGQIPGFARF